MIAKLSCFPKPAVNEMNVGSGCVTANLYPSRIPIPDLPTLAKVIVDKNIAGTEPKMNFIGFAVGNPFTDPIENAYGRYGTFWGRQLIPRPLYDAWDKRCKGMFWRHNDVRMAQERHCGQSRFVEMGLLTNQSA
jgi:hypothetical protein